MSIRCTPFCSPCDKDYKHHELLVALLNTRDTDNCLDESDHENLQKVIKKHKCKGWDINTEILESNEEFRFPLLHWACVLGKTRTVRWLIKNGFSPTAQTKDTLETCVHRALLTLPDISSTKSGRLSMLRFETILPHLRDCLTIGNHRQDTPLHIAAHFMVQNKSCSLYQNIFQTMLTEIQKMPRKEQLKCLNAQNGSGDTALNLLSKGCNCLAAIEKLLDAGADSMLVNKLNMGPLDNAERHGLVHIANFLKSSVLRDCAAFTPQAASNLSNEESRKRRSERRSTYNNTMASLSVFCQGDMDNLQKTETSSPIKGSESIKSDETVTMDDTEIVPLTVFKDDEMSSMESSQDSSLTLLSSPIVLEHSTTEVKNDDDNDDLCQCCGDENENPIPTASSTMTHDSTDSELRLFDAMKEAGVLANLTDVISQTKAQHLGRMKALEKSMMEVDGKEMKREEREKHIQKEIEKKTREIEKLNMELIDVCKQKADLSKKRKLMEEKGQDLRKKVVCCEKLLKTVPNDNCM